MIRLLLVEDDNNLSYIVQTGLQDIIGGYEVITACNGKEGLEAWKEHHPDIIISDIDMPVMNGFEMVRLIRETDGDTPILFASALTSPKDVRKGYDIGVNNYVKKPFIPDELDAHLHAILKMKEGARSRNESKHVQVRQLYTGCRTRHPPQYGYRTVDNPDRPGGTDSATAGREQGGSGQKRSHPEPLLGKDGRLFRFTQPGRIYQQTSQAV